MTKIVSNSTTGTGTCTSYGDDYSGADIISGGYGPHTSTVSYPRTNYYTESETSPGQWKKVIKYVEFRPRGRVPRMPSLPFPPTYLPPRPPKARRSNQSKRSYDRVLRKYSIRLNVYEQKFAKLMSVYWLRTTNYKRKMDHFNKYLSKVRNGVPKSMRVRNVVRSGRPFNNYTKSIFYGSGTSGTIIQNNLVWFPGRGQNTGRQYISGNVAAAGYTADTFNPGLWSRAINNVELSYVSSTADSRARKKLYDKINEQSVHIANLIAERHQTVSLVRDLFKRAVTLINNLSLKKIGALIGSYVFSKGGLKKNLSNDTLAVTFGLLPLYKDIYGAAETLAHYAVDNLKDAVFVKSRSSYNQDLSYTETGYGYDSARGGQYEICKSVVKISKKATIGYVLNYETDNFLSAELQKLGLINPAEVLWETMPWSFVVDWILPVGTYLRSLTADTGLVFARGVVSSKIETTITVTTSFVEQPPPLNYGYNEWKSGGFTETRTYYDKTRRVIFSAPQVPMPAFKNPLSSYHVIESFALFFQKLKSR